MCSNCLSREPLALLGDNDGPGFLEERGLVDAICIDSLGNFWVGQTGLIKVFSAAGDYLRQVGRPGQGPLEFNRPKWLHLDQQDRVHIMDVGTQRESIISADFRLVEERRLPGFPRDAAALEDGDRWVAQMAIQTAERIGLPLHIFEGDQILFSFGGSTGRDAQPLTPITAQRVLATDDADHIFSVSPYEYTIEVWTATGERVTGFKRPLLNTSMPKAAPLSDENPPLNRIFDLSLGPSGRLWVGSWRVRSDWRERVVERIDPTGRVALEPIDNDASLYYTRIDIIDLDSASVIARHEQDQFIFRFLGDGMVAEAVYGADWELQVAVSRLTLNMQSGSDP